MRVCARFRVPSFGGPKSDNNFSSATLYLLDRRPPQSHDDHPQLQHQVVNSDSAQIHLEYFAVAGIARNLKQDLRAAGEEAHRQMASEARVLAMQHRVKPKPAVGSVTFAAIPEKVLRNVVAQLFE